MWLNLGINLLTITNILLSIGIIAIVLLQRGEDGAFSKSSMHNVVKNSVNTLWSKTWKLILVFLFNMMILSLLIHMQYYDKSKYISPVVITETIQQV